MTDNELLAKILEEVSKFNNNHELLKNIFGILSITIAIATFLPTLVYSYTKGYLDDIYNHKITDQNNSIITAEKKLSFKKAITNFVFSIDLIITQSIIMVGFTAISSLFLYLYQHSNDQHWIPFVITSWWVIYLVIIFFSWQTSKGLKKEYKDKNLWEKGNGVFISVFIFVSVYALSELLLSWTLFCQKSQLLYSNEDFMLVMITISIISLILSALSWIWPVLIFSPLRKKIDSLP